MIDQKSRSQYNKDQWWNDNFPPLNLWNYNLYWQWAEQWKFTFSSDIKDSTNEHASGRSLAQHHRKA